MIEILISISILSLILFSFGLVLSQREGAFRSAHSLGSLETRSRQSISRVVSELNGTGADMIWPDPSTDFGTASLNFRKAVGVTDGAIDWGPVTTIAFAYSDGELDDGIDNNGNGLIDEGMITMSRNVGEANETQTVICRDVAEFFPGETDNGADDNGNGVWDERGFNAHQDGDMLTIRMALVDLDAAGRIMNRTSTTSVRLRN